MQKIFSLKICTTLLLLFVSINSVFSAASIKYTDAYKKAYQAVFSLHFTQAEKIIAQEKINDPENFYYVYLENCIDGLSIILSQDASLFQKYESRKAARLNKLQELSLSESPYYLLFQAEIKLHWAVAYLTQEQFTKAASEISSANKLLKQNQKKFPNFIQNQKSLGVIHAVVGTVPEKYQWVVNLLGFSGNVDQGMKELKDFLDKSPNQEFYEEANLFYTYFLFYLKNDIGQAMKRTELPAFNLKNNPLNAMIASLLAMKDFRSNLALNICTQVNRSETYPLPYLDYFIGECKLYKNDADADQYLIKFLKNYKGKHKVKSVNQKIAWFYLLQNNQAKYEEYMRKVTASGATFMDSDKIAENDAKSGLIPNSSLLKVRLNSDGGYFTEALLKLNSIKLTSLTFEEKIEYYYRNARIQQLSKLYDLSLLSYQQVIKIAQGSTSYYAPKSCLEMATIYEKNKKNYPLALQYYQKVLTYKNHSYKNSLDQQAKAGLSRLKN